MVGGGAESLSRIDSISWAWRSTARTRPRGVCRSPAMPTPATPSNTTLPPQLGWVERRIEDVRGRDGPCLRRCEMEDRAAPPVRRDGGAADPETFDPERAGIDHDRPFVAGDAQDLQSKTRDDCLLIGHSESEPPDDAVGIRLDPDLPGGQRSGAEIGLALHQGFVALQERPRIVPRLADRGGAERV